VRALSQYKGNSFVLISTPELRLPDYIKKELVDSGAKVREFDRVGEALPDLDVLYMTRIQKERFEQESDYEKQSDLFMSLKIDEQKLKSAKSDLIIMHPLPRLDEIAEEVDDDPRAVYFKQANYGMYVRMALILHILNYEISMKPLFVGTRETNENVKSHKCENPKCIVNHERLPAMFVKTPYGVVCEYCEKPCEKP
jgi:aspartate carbamoyltransferase catalytic subunit